MSRARCSNVLAGAVTLSHALRQWDNDKLRELDLGYNEVGDDGACQIARVRLCNLAFRV